MFGLDDVFAPLQGAASAAGAVLGYAGAQDQMDAQHDMFMNAQQYNQYNADTQWQRGVKDMEAAGLNPMLAYAKGGNQSATSPAPMQGVNKWEAAITSANAFADIDVKKAQAEKLRADAVLARESKGQPTALTQKIVDESANLLEQANLNAATRRRVEEEIRNAIEERKLITARTGNTDADTAILKINKILQENLIQKSSNEAEAQKSWWMRNIGPYMPDLLRGSNSAGSAARIFK
jgi:hypothetical protein